MIPKVGQKIRILKTGLQGASVRENDVLVIKDFKMKYSKGWYIVTENNWGFDDYELGKGWVLLPQYRLKREKCG